MEFFQKHQNSISSCQNFFLVMNPMMMNMMMSNMMNMYMNNPKMQEMLAMQMMNQGGPNQSMSHSGSQQQILNGSHFSLPQIKQT